MTARLSQLLHDEATHLVPPVPDTAAVLAEGHRLRRRQRVTAGLAAAGVAALVAATVGVVVVAGDGGSRAVDPATTDDHAAWAVGSDVHVDGHTAQVPDTVHSLHYTAAGVLVRSNPHDGASDGSGPESLTLVRWDGSTVDLGTVPEGVGPATDPDEDVYALAEPAGDGFVAVVRDVETGDVARKVPLPDLPPSYWEVPPLGLDGDTLYVGYRNQTVALDIATGEGGPVDGLGGGMPAVAGGHTVARQGGEDAVLDVVSGKTLLTLAGGAWPVLSPDGSLLLLGDQVLDVSTGATTTLPSTGSDWGWTSGGDLFAVAGDRVTTCDATTAECTDDALTPPLPRDAFPRLGGRTYES
ncbi:hypothetical protein [Nocardioides taihuensis]|uniref:WD40 repeat domain-containing protein n=1 Tax=Nocardioides taihuensis TaxID=1835606 RepID=A0ABW0BPU5_9ACTN